MAVSPRASTLPPNGLMLKDSLDPVEHLFCMLVVPVIIGPPRRRATLTGGVIRHFWYTFEAALVRREGARHSNAVFVISCVDWRGDAAELDVQAFFIIKLP